MNNADERAAPQAPWLAWPIGAKVVIRRRLADGKFSDVVGLLVSADPTQVTVHGRRGQVTIPAELIALSKLVPAPVLGPRSRRQPPPRVR